MEAYDTIEDNMEIRSEKVRNLVGEMPRSLVIWGIVVIAAVSLALLAAMCLVEYPYSHGESILGHVIEQIF